MKKLLITTAFVLPFAFAPAFAQDAEPAPVDPAADAAAAEAEAAAAAEEALKAEVAESGKVVQEQAGNELRLDWVTSGNVSAPDGTAIGKINDLIVDGETGQMIAAVIGVGGFLGIGEKQIAVPWEQLTVNTDAQEITTDLTKEEADVAPAYVFREQSPAPGSEAPADPMANPAADPMPDPAADPAAEAPADDSMAPADDAMAPVEGEEAPADDAMAPVEGEEASADDAMAPVEGEDAPADDAMAPVEGEDAPAN